MPSNIKSFFISGPRGHLEALLNSGAGNATHAALVCHPHPLHGGTVHNKVVYHTMKALSAHGFPVLRFNFPGAGRSQGNHDDGRGEVDDAQAALDWLDNEFHLPIIAAGFSFGSNVILRASCGDPRVRGCISLGTPIAADQRSYSYGFLKDCAMPKLFVSGSQDHFSPTSALQSVVAGAAPPNKLVVIDGADHFFVGKLEQLRQEIDAWLRAVVLHS